MNYLVNKFTILLTGSFHLSVWYLTTFSQFAASIFASYICFSFLIFSFSAKMISVVVFKFFIVYCLNYKYRFLYYILILSWEGLKMSVLYLRVGIPSFIISLTWLQNVHGDISYNSSLRSVWSFRILLIVFHLTVSM